MQPLARDGLTAEQVTALLQAADLTVTGGLDLLAPDLTFREDISDDLVSGSVSRNVNADVHGTVTLALARELVWGVDLVRPHVTLSDGEHTARFDLGVFLLTTPVRQVGAEPATYSVTGYDRLVLLQRQVGDHYYVQPGVTYRQAILDAFTAAGLSGVLIDGAAADSTVPTEKAYPLVGRSTNPDQAETPVTWLRIVNDLLGAINFRGVWCDEQGRYRCSAYQPPSDRPTEFTFDADDVLGTIVGADRSVTADVWSTPNRWVFRWRNAPEGTDVNDLAYTRANQSDGPTSIDARGLTWTSVVDYEAASRTALIALGDRRVTADRATTVTHDVTVGPFPAAGHADLYAYRDAATGGDRRVQLLTSTVDLLGDDTRMTWQEVP